MSETDLIAVDFAWGLYQISNRASNVVASIREVLEGLDPIYSRVVAERVLTLTLVNRMRVNALQGGQNTLPRSSHRRIRKIAKKLVASCNFHTRMLQLLVRRKASAVEDEAPHLLDRLKYMITWGYNDISRLADTMTAMNDALASVAPTSTPLYDVVDSPRSAATALPQRHRPGKPVLGERTSLPSHSQSGALDGSPSLALTFEVLLNALTGLASLEGGSTLDQVVRRLEIWADFPFKQEPRLDHALAGIEGGGLSLKPVLLDCAGKMLLIAETMLIESIPKVGEPQTGVLKSMASRVSSVLGSAPKLFEHALNSWAGEVMDTLQVRDGGESQADGVDDQTSDPPGREGVSRQVALLSTYVDTISDLNSTMGTVKMSYLRDADQPSSAPEATNGEDKAQKISLARSNDHANGRTNAIDEKPSLRKFAPHHTKRMMSLFLSEERARAVQKENSEDQRPSDGQKDSRRRINLCKCWPTTHTYDA